MEEVEDRDTEEADIERLGASDNLEDEARNIKVIETDFKRPLRSSFRAKKGEKRYKLLYVYLCSMLIRASS